MSFSENLQFLRDRSGMTQEQLAEQLEVSRQSVSKWESAASYPEMEKLMQLCQLFHTDLDTLVRGDVSQRHTQGVEAYDRLMNWFSKMIAGGVGLVLAGIAAAMLAASAGRGEPAAAAVLLSAVAAAVMLFILAGMRHDSFGKKYPYLPPVYSPEQTERFDSRFPMLIAAPVTAILIGVVWIVLFGERAEQAGEAAELRLMALFLLDIAASTAVLVWAGIQKSKYDLDGWNRKHDQSPEAEARRKKCDWICGVIMLLATAVYLAVGFGFMAAANDYGNDTGWRWGWIVYPVAGVLCGAASTYIDRDS